MTTTPGGNKGKGRPKGSPNKVTRELKAMAAKYTKKGVKLLAEIAFSKRHSKNNKGDDEFGYVYDVEARAKAIGMLLDRAHGKAPIAVTGEGGEGPVEIKTVERVIVDKS